MSYTRSGVNLNIIFSSLFSFLLSKPKQQKNKTYDYTQCVAGRDYVLEVLNDLNAYYMTGQGKNIKCGDYIILEKNSTSEQYQVEQIDYYSEPSDMWMALLKKVTVE